MKQGIVKYKGKTYIVRVSEKKTSKKKCAPKKKIMRVKKKYKIPKTKSTWLVKKKC